MNRSEAIQRIVWCLLNHTEHPEIAVATVETLKGSLGTGNDGQMTFTNLLRAAGLFAKDDDGYFMRYRLEEAIPDESLLNLPSPNHLITFPVPTEPRMRIAYSIFSGLLLKYIYQTYGAVPTEVSEGIARFVTNQPLPDSHLLWNEFKQSESAANAVGEGLEATFGAIRNIGGIDVTETMADSALLRALLNVLPQFGRKFQAQGGMRLDFYFRKDINDWLTEYAPDGRPRESISELWQQGFQEENLSIEIAKKIAGALIHSIDLDQPLPMRTFRSLWTGEGSGVSRKRGERDTLPQPTGDEGKRSKAVDDAVLRLLSQLDEKRQDTHTLHQWMKPKLKTPQSVKLLDEVVTTTQSLLVAEAKAKAKTIDASSLVEDIATAFRTQTVITTLRKSITQQNKEVQKAIEQTLALCLIIELAARLEENVPISILGWRVSMLHHVPVKQEWVLRFLKKRKPEGGKRILKIAPFGDIEHLTVSKAEPQQISLDFGLGSNTSKPSIADNAFLHHVPMQCFKLDGKTWAITPESLLSEQRCLICGSATDLLVGAKSFLPEAKKRHYETPTREEAPSFCSNCAFIAYLSSIYPSSDLSIVEFPTNNFLELFALYESLQGVSALQALKYVNRVASLSVLPNRYLLLSHRDGRGKMDGKAQVCLQLREQAHLIKDVDRPMRVQIEGSIPQMWSEIAPHIPIGLSHFKELPPYFETDSTRKGFAYDVVRALQTGQPYKAFYAAAKYAVDNGHPFEQRVFTKNRKVYECYINQHRQKLAKSLGGETVSNDIYQDITKFSNYLFDLLHPLVRREVQKSRSAVSGISRKYTDLILREFSEGLAGKFLYTVCQEADSAERQGDGWVKYNTFTKLYGGSPKTKGKTVEEVTQAWDEFRQSHPVLIEVNLQEYRCKHGTQYVIWQKFLREVQARTLALLMLNVRHSS